MRALNAIDHVFLMLETRKEPMHVSGLCIFEVPDGAGDDFLTKLVSDIEVTRTKPSFPFNQVLSKGLFWEPDGDFDVNHHFRHVALPKPGGTQELTNYISREHGLMLDRAKPLWEFHLIDGLAPAYDGGNARFALFLKIHHAMADGIAAMRLLQMSLSASKTEKMSAPFWSLSTKYRSQINAILPIHKPPLKIIKEQLATIYPVGRELVNSVKNHFGGKNLHFTSTFDAPKSILNQKISSSRQLSFVSFKKGDLQRLPSILGRRPMMSCLPSVQGRCVNICSPKMPYLPSHSSPLCRYRFAVIKVPWAISSRSSLPTLPRTNLTLPSVY